MSRLRLPLVTIAAALLAASAAQAADYGQPMPPQPYYQPPPAIEPAPLDNWYLCGFVGVGMNANYGLDVTPMPSDTFFTANSIGDSTFIGGGLG